ncbi:hypothetical protein KUTeg_019045 [Tegillarca granosa]|uniref:BPTI/Kunitz inhibitor domain-containing protein n=1 Tax=Tegillarca granosa TaxID=220873 RepID=A0ABQ9EBC8_TEGGR|nr:hypothetical protein KUTeg_019045 [Tegillarca granosa]
MANVRLLVCQFILTVIVTVGTVSGDRPGACDEPKDVGPCKALKPRWYYNRNSGQCERFNWGGCRPNGNNFRSQKECESQCEDGKLDPAELANLDGITIKNQEDVLDYFWGGCRPNGNNFLTRSACERKCSSTDICSQPKKPGMCMAAFRRWYFDTASNTCRRFIYGGCQGNDNNFSSKIKCLRQCSVPDVCKLKKQPGNCRAYIPRFYYNGLTGRCETFIYGGCGGNENNFKTWRTCRKSCRIFRG